MSGRGTFRWSAVGVAAALLVMAADEGARAAEAREVPPVARSATAVALEAEPHRGRAWEPFEDSHIGAPGADAARNYAQREARHPHTADFRGGDSVGIYIGGGAGLVIVLLLVLLLVR